MAKKPPITTKRLAINKTNSKMVIVTAVAAFVTVFCVVASHSLLGEVNYQNRVTGAKQKALTQLKSDATAESSLVSSYKSFVGKPTNIIGGSSTGGGNNAGDNGVIILDALPSQYDFPGLTSSLEKVFSSLNVTVSSISGTDDEVAQLSNTASATPQPVSIPFSFTITNANYASIQNLLTTLQSSIRPIQIDTMTLSGGASNMQLTVNAHTFYQPAKNFKVTTEVVK